MKALTILDLMGGKKNKKNNQKQQQKKNKKKKKKKNETQCKTITILDIKGKKKKQKKQNNPRHGFNSHSYEARISYTDVLDGYNDFTQRPGGKKSISNILR